MKTYYLVSSSDRKHNETYGCETMLTSLYEVKVTDRIGINAKVDLPVTEIDRYVIAKVLNKATRANGKYEHLETEILDKGPLKRVEIGLNGEAVFVIDANSRKEAIEKYLNEEWTGVTEDNKEEISRIISTSNVRFENSKFYISATKSKTVKKTMREKKEYEKIKLFYKPVLPDPFKDFKNIARQDFEKEYAKNASKKAKNEKAEYYAVEVNEWPGVETPPRMVGLFKNPNEEYSGYFCGYWAARTFKNTLMLAFKGETKEGEYKEMALRKPVRENFDIMMMHGKNIVAANDEEAILEFFKQYP